MKGLGDPIKEGIISTRQTLRHHLIDQTIIPIGGRLSHHIWNQLSDPLFDVRDQIWELTYLGLRDELGRIN